tara:strand:- start:343 stop:825 length:483 start_codon:yes stop_codon:yes gene_type:complete
MKKYLLVVFAIIFLSSCEEEVQFNNPSFQGLKDNVFWRATQSEATISANGSVVIKAYAVNEVVTLKTSASTVQVYAIGTSNSSTATYVLTTTAGAITFSSGIDIGNGQVQITEYDAVNKTISGTFKFNLENIFNDPLAGATLNFQQGVFYKVPVKSASTP